jgi:hypothetical protein
MEKEVPLVLYCTEESKDGETQDPPEVVPFAINFQLNIPLLPSPTIFKADKITIESNLFGEDFNLNDIAG